MNRRRRIAGKIQRFKIVRIKAVTENLHKTYYYPKHQKYLSRLLWNESQRNRLEIVCSAERLARKWVRVHLQRQFLKQHKR